MSTEIKTTEAFTTPEGKTAIKYDVVNESILNNKPIEDVFEEMLYNDEAVINTPEYYKQQYGIKANPSNPNALEDKQIDAFVTKAKVLKEQFGKMKQYGTTPGEVSVQREFLERKAKYKGIVLNPYMGEIGSEKAYKGFLNPETGTYATIGTEEEIAEANDYMYEAQMKIDENGMPRSILTRVPKPATQAEFHKKYGDGQRVVTTIREENTDQPVFVAMPADSFVADGNIYSTKYGAQKMFSDSFLGESWKGFYNGLWSKTMRSGNEVRGLLNDALRYDKTHIFSQGPEIVNNFANQVLDILSQDGNYKGVEMLKKAIEEDNYIAMSDAFDYAYANIDPVVSNRLKRIAQPLNWQKVNMEVVRSFNDWTSASMDQSEQTRNGRTASAVLAGYSEMVGMLAPQIAIAMATGGATTGINMAVAGARGAATKLALNNAIKFGAKTLTYTLGTSQAVGSDMYRSLIEAGLEQGEVGRTMIWSLPVMFATEKFTDGWMFKSMDDPTRRTLIDQVWKPGSEAIQKAVSKGAPDAVKQKAVSEMFTKLFKNKTFQNWLDKGSFGADLVRANISEAIQENMEDAIYNGLEYYLNENAPVWAEVGKGKSEVDSLFIGFDQLANTTGGTIFATTLMQTLLSGIPRGIRKMRGLPDTNKDTERDQWLMHKVLTNEANQVATEMFEGWQRGEWHGEKGTPPVSLTEGFLTPEEASGMIVPKSKYLQEFGFEEGKQIETVGEARFIEAITTLEAFEDLSNKMGLNEVSKEALLQSGFKGKLLLQKSFESYKNLVEYDKAPITAFEEANSLSLNTVLDKVKQNEVYAQQGLEESVVALTEKENELLTIAKDYIAAKRSYDYHTEIEKGTSHTAAINDMMKEFTTIVTQVNSEMDKMMGNANGHVIPDDIKARPDYKAKYFEAWNKIVKEKFSYPDYKGVVNRLEGLKQKADARRSKIVSDIENKTVFNEIMGISERFGKQFEGLKKEYSRQQLTKLFEDFSLFTKQLTMNMTSPTSFVDNQQLDELRSKYSEQYSQIKQAMKIAEQNEVESAKDEMVAETNQEELNELRDKYQKGLTETVFDNDGNPMEVGIHLNKNTPQYFDGRKNRKLNLIPFRNETNEEYQERVNKIISENTVDYKNYVEELADNVEKEIAELEAWIESVNKNNDSYKAQYPNGKYNNSNAAMIASSVIDSIESSREPITNSFTVAKAINGVKNYTDYANEVERKITEALASEEAGNVRDKLNEQYSKLDKIKDGVGQAEYLIRAKREHMRTVMVENNIHSLVEILSHDIMINDTDKLQNPLFDQIKALKPLDEEVLAANGNYTNEQLKILSERKSLFNNVLSFLTQNKEVVFSERNLPGIFGIYEAYAQKGNYNQETSIFYQADPKAVSGNTNTVRNSRESGMVPMNVNGVYFFDGLYGEKSVLNPDIVKMRLKEHLNVLTWIASGYTVNDLTAIRKDMLKENRNIETEEQESVVNSIIAFLTGDDVYKKLYDYLDRNNNYSSKENKYSVNTLYNALTVTGDYGVGKTQFVFKQAMSMLARLELNKESRIKGAAVVSITKNLEKVHKETFDTILPEGTKYLDFKSGFVENIDNLDTSEGMVYIVDEASILIREEFEALMNKFNGTKAKIIFLGDIFQMRDATSSDKLPHIITRTMNTHLLTEQFSSNSSLLRELANEPRSKAVGTGNLSEQIPTVWNVKVFSKIVDGKLQGGHYYVDENEMSKAFTNNLTNESKRAIIFANQAHLDAFLAKAEKSVSDAIRANMDKVYFGFRMGNAETSKLIQGLREEEVYVMIDPVTAKERFGIKEEAIVSSALYTSIGRASNFVGLISGDQSLNAKNENEALSIGQPVSTDNPLVQDMLDRFKAKTDLFYSYINSDNYRNYKEEDGDTGNTGNKKENNQNEVETFSEPIEVNNVKYKVNITVDKKNDSVIGTFPYKGAYRTVEVVGGNLSSQGRATIIAELRDLMIKELTVNPDPIITKRSVTHATIGSDIVTITDYVEVNGTRGTIDEIIEVNDNGKVSHELVIDGKVVTVKPTDVINFVEVEDVEDNTGEGYLLRITKSYNKYVANKNLFTIWSTSVSLVGMSSNTTAPDKQKRRNFNDIVLGNINAFMGNKNSANGAISVKLVKGKYTYLNDKNEEVTEDNMMVVQVEVKNRPAFEALIAKHGKMYKAIDVPKENTFVIGTVTMPARPVYNANKDAGYYSYERIQNGTSREQLAKEWDNAQLPGDTQNKTRDNLRDMNLAIYDMYNSSEKEFEVKSFLDGEIKIQYQAEVQTLQEFSDNSQYNFEIKAPYSGKNKAGNRRIIVKTNIPGVSEIICTMPTFGQNPVAWQSLSSRISKEKPFDVSLQKMANKFIEEQEQVKALNSDFINSLLARFILNNYAELKSNPTLSNKLFGGLISIKDNHHVDIVGKNAKEVQENYKKVVERISKLSSYDVNTLYDFAEVEKNGSTRILTDHDGNPLINDLTSLYTHAFRINNVSAYPQIDKPAIPENKKAPEQPKDTNLPPIDNFSFQHVDEINQSADLSKWITELDQFLGSEFVSEHLTITGKILRDEQGRLVAGYVQNGDTMVLSTVTGRENTARHEAFHYVYQNYLEEQYKRALNNAAKIIALSEGKILNNDKDVEEWMAEDFSNTRTLGYSMDEVNNAVGLWEKFKAFMRMFFKYFNPVYYANKLVVSEYNNIVDGKYRNATKVSEITENTISYSHDVAEDFEAQIGSAYESEINAEQYVSNRDAIVIANKVKRDLKASLKTNQALVNNELRIGFDIVDLSITGSTNSILSIAETIDAIVNKRKSQNAVLASHNVIVNYKNKPTLMTISKVEESKLQDNIISHQDMVLYDNYILTKEENTRALIQLKVPAYNIQNNSWGSKAGPDERFDWSRFVVEDYLSNDKVLFLSSIPRLNADGSIASAPQSTFIPFRNVTTILKDLGKDVITEIRYTKEEMSVLKGKDKEAAQKIIQSKISFNSLKAIMEKRIAESKKVDGKFVDENTQIIYSIYERIYGKPDYSKLNDHGTTISLIQKYENIASDIRNEMMMYEDSQVIRPDNNLLNMAETANSIINFVTGITTIYSSMYIKDMIKTTYYGETVKSVFSFRENYKTDSKSIENKQQWNIDKGELNKSIRTRIENNVKFTESAIETVITSKIGNTPVLVYTNGKWSFVSETGDAFNSPEFNYDKTVDFIIRMKNDIGLGMMRNTTINRIMEANNWEEVTNIIVQSKFGNADWYENFMSNIVQNYEKPIDFLSDYIGTIFTMYNQYGKNRSITTYDANGDSSRTSVTIHEYVNSDDMRGLNLLQKFEAIPGSDIILSFINKTQPETLRTFEYTEDTETDAYKLAEGETQERYIDFEDIWVANDLMASMIQKIEGKSTNSMIRTAEGNVQDKYVSRSALTDQLDVARMESIYGITFDSIVESVGIANNIGFTTYGTKKIETPDYIETSINMFSQHVLKGKILVPMKPASDTGVIRYLSIDADFIKTDKNLSFNYTKIAESLFSIEERHNNKVKESNNRIKKFLSELKQTKEFSVFTIDETVTDPIAIVNLLNDLVAGDPELIKKLKDYIDHSDLIKDVKIRAIGEYSNFDIGYTGLKDSDGKFVIDPITKEYVITGITAGRMVINDIKGYEWLRERQKGSKPNVMANLHEAYLKGDEKLVKQYVQRLFKDDFIKFGRMANNYGFNAVGSTFRLSNQLNSGTMAAEKFYQKNSKGLMEYNELYFGYFLSSFIANNAFETVGMDAYSFDGYMDLVKRFGSDNTPRITPNVNQVDTNGDFTGTMADKVLVIPIRDKRDTTEETAKTVDGKTEWSVDEASEVTNGQVTVNPLFYTFFKRSYGGVENTILGNSKAIKPIGNMQRPDGSYMLLKSGFVVLSGSDMNHLAYRNMFNRMLEESDRLIAKENTNEDGTVNDYPSLKVLYEELYDASVTKDFDEIMEAMHTVIVNKWQFTYGKEMYKSVVNNIVAMMAPISTIKSPVKALNSYDPLNEEEDYNYAYEEMSSTSIGAVMNPSQPTNTSKMQAQPNQFDAQMGVGDAFIQSESRYYRQQRAELQANIENEIAHEISQYKSKDGKDVPVEKRFSDIDFNNVDPFELESGKYDLAFEQLEQFLRERIVADLSVNEEELGYIDLMNSGTSRHLPVMRSRMLSTYRNYINNAVQARTPGSRLTQFTGYYHRYFIDPETSLPMSRNDVLNVIYSDRGGWKGLSYQEINSITDEDLIAAGYEMKSLSDMTRGKDNTNSGTISMPNLLADKYGHRKEETLYEIMTVNIAGKRIALMNNEGLYDSLAEVLSTANDSEYDSILTSFLQSPMVRKAVENLNIYGKAELISQASNETDPLSEAAASKLESDYAEYVEEMDQDDYNNSKRLEQRNVIEELSGKKMDDMTITEKVMFTIVEDIQKDGKMLEKIIKEAQSLATDFNDSMTLMLSRVPLTFIGSGGIYKTVIFNNDNGNIVYIPVGMTNRNDSDFDIDALTAYVNSINSKGHIIKNGTGAIINNMNKNRIAVYLNKENETQLLIKSTTGNIKDVVAKSKGIMVNNSLTSIFEAYDRNKAGADAIGILANALNAIGMIMTVRLEGKSASAKGSMIDKVLNSNIDKNFKVVMGDKGIIYRLGSWEQIALDNNKSNTLGAYNVRSYVVNILASMVIDGKTPEQIYEFFNNKYIIQIFDEYAKGQRLKESTRKYDLYTIATQKGENVKTYIANNSSLTNWNKVNNIEDQKNVISDLTKFKSYEELSNKIDASVAYLNNQINVVLQERIISEIEGNKKHSRFINDKISIEEGVEMFRREYGITMDNIYEGKETSIEDVELETLIGAISELNKKRNMIYTESFVSLVPKYSVMAESMFRLSQIMQLRNGIKVMDGDFNRSKNMIENSLGMTLKQYVTSEDINDENQHIRWFKANNERYNELMNDLSKGDSKAYKNMEYLEKKEREVFRELNISSFVRMVPQLDNIIRILDKQDTITSLMFMVDNTLFKQMGMEFLDMQKRKSIAFPNQLSLFQNAVYELAFDKFFNEHGSKTNITMSNVKYDFTNVFDRQDFALSFPQFAIQLQSNATDIDFWRSILSFEDFNKLTTDNLNNLQENIFLKSLAVSGLTRKRLSTSVNTSDMVSTELARYRDAFNQLPESIKTMFTYYELIENKMNFRKGSIMHIIGTDFYKNNLTDTFNGIYDGLFNNGLSTFTGNPDNIDILKDKFFDYLGMNEEFAPMVGLNNVDIVDGPRYIWNYGEEKTTLTGQKIRDNKPIFYKKSQSGVYEPLNKNTWKSTISMNEDTNSQYKTFLRGVDEVNEYRLNTAKNISTRHVSTNHTFSKGEILRSGKDVLVVTSVAKGHFMYKNALPNDIEKWDSYLHTKTQEWNDVIKFKPGTVEYELLHKDSQFPISVSSGMTLVVNGKQVLTKGKNYNTIEELMMDYYSNVVKTIPGWNKDYIVKDRFHYNNLVRDLFKQANSVFDENATEKKSAIVAMMEGSHIIFKEAFKQRFASFEATGKKVSDVLLDKANKERRFDTTMSRIRIGKFTYDELVYQAFREYSNKNTEVMEREMEVVSSLSSERISEVFNSGKDAIKTAINSDIKTSVAGVVETSTLNEIIDERSSEVVLADNNIIYQEAGNNILRLGNFTSWVENKVLLDPDINEAEFIRHTFKTSNPTPEQIAFGKKQYKAFKEGRYLVSRMKQESNALKVGTSVDKSFRSFAEWFNNEYQRTKKEPGYKIGTYSLDKIINPVGMNYSHVQKEQLVSIMESYMNAWVNWSKAHNFDNIEFITKDTPVTTTFNSDSVNNVFEYTDASGKVQTLSGVGSQLDMIIRLTKRNGGNSFISDIVVDYKTMNMANKDMNPTILKWALQTYISSEMYKENYNVSLFHHKRSNKAVHGILPIGTRWNKGKFEGFELPDTIERSNTEIPVASNVEYWNNNDKYDKDNDYLPMFVSNLTGKPLEYANAIARGTEDTGSNFKTTLDEQHDNSETEQKCKTQ